MRRLILCVLSGLALAANAVAGGITPMKDDAAYSVVWDSPSADASGSMPLGNGDLGANVWVQANGDLVFYLSQGDAWSSVARILKLGRVRISLSPNPFAAGEPFRQTLDTRKGVVEIASGAGASRCALRVWVDAHYPVVRVEIDSRRPIEVLAATEIWRQEPRTIRGAEAVSVYGLSDRAEPVIEEGDALVATEDASVVWQHRNETSMWAESLRHQSLADWAAQGQDPLLHRTFGGLIQGAGLVKDGPERLRSAAPAKRYAIAVYALNRIAHRPEQWLREIRQLAENDATDWKKARKAHEQWWNDFAARSWIHVASPGADAAPQAAIAQLNQGYALHRYVQACAGRGAVPIKFNGSIFTVDAEKNDERFNADFRAWGAPYWFQNTRLMYWPMLAAGDFDCMRPLFKMYHDALPFAQARTRTYFQHGGAFFPETMYPWGAYADENYGWVRKDLPAGTTENTYIRYYYDGALELLALMLDYYAYTGDEAFVRGQLLPLADAVLQFYDEHYPRDADGKLHLTPSQALETWQVANNPLPPIAGLRWVCRGLLALPKPLVSASQRAAYEKLIAILPELPRGEMDGKPVLCPAAEVLEEERNVEDPELYAVFPYRVFGVGKPELEVARATYAIRKHKGNQGWRQDETWAAYLGLADEACALLLGRAAKKHEASRFPAFYGPNFDWNPDQTHGGNLVKALQTMLLQCDDGKIRLFPAWPKVWDVDFKLHAPGEVVVEGIYAGGTVQRLKVTPSRRKANVDVLSPQ